MMKSGWQQWCVLLIGCPSPVTAGGGQKLWQLGSLVDENPLTIFCMFVLVVILSVTVEWTRHYVEHRTRNQHKRRALDAIYTELMMVGVVAFLLILGAELGLTDLKLRKPFCSIDDTGSNGSGSGTPTTDAGSGSGSELPTCYVGFDLLMFEYAHLVLFFMGIMYCIFIQVALVQLERQCNALENIEKTTLAGWIGPKGFTMPTVLGVMGIGCTTAAWARAIIVVRAAMCLKLKDELEDAADKKEAMLEHTMAEYRREPAPAPRPDPPTVQEHFSVARFAKLGASEVMIDLLHVPVSVWFSIVLVAGGDIFRVLGLSLQNMLIIYSLFGPTLALLVLWRMSENMITIVRNTIGHPKVYDVEQISARGPRLEGERVKLVDQKLAAQGSHWADQDARQRAGEPFTEVDHPWAELEGCCSDDHVLNCLDPLDPQALQLQIQVVIFVSCFYVGQIMMLSSLILDKMGAPILILLWLLPMVALLVLIPRAILIYTLVHRTSKPPRSWLIYAIKPHDDPTTHGHGHGDEYGDHGPAKHTSATDSPRAAVAPWMKAKASEDPRNEALKRLRIALDAYPELALDESMILHSSMVPPNRVPEFGTPRAGAASDAPPFNGGGASVARAWNNDAGIVNSWDNTAGPVASGGEVAGYKSGDPVRFAGSKGLVAATTREGKLHVVVQGMGLLADVDPSKVRAVTPVSSPPSTPPALQSPDAALVVEAVQAALRGVLSPGTPMQSISVQHHNPLSSGCARASSPATSLPPDEEEGENVALYHRM
eukprot:Hpha_TRINITY_DN88_c0_g1::TRINITY_DN88_c0_g1_i1::g.110192::m.110192